VAPAQTAVAPSFVRIGRTAAALVLAAALALQLARACFSPADAFAVEVVLNKPGVSYDLSPLAGVASLVEYAGGRAYAYRSSYDPRLIVVVSEQELPAPGGDASPAPRYLAVRLQLPLEVRAVFTGGCQPAPNYSMRVGLTIEVGAGSGSRVVELGTLQLGEPALARFVLRLRPLELTGNLTVSGVLLLEGAGGPRYRVEMPCLLSVGEPCFRVMVLLPGYDAPMLVEAGTYRVLLELAWQASARSVLLLEGLEVRREPGALEEAQTSWAVSGQEARKDAGGASIVVDLKSGRWRIEVRNLTREPPAEALEEVRRLGGLLGFTNCTPATLSSDVGPAVEIGEGELVAALKAELERLARIGVVRGLSQSDIEGVAKAARLGYAGWNSRLVWYNGSWVPYSSVPGAALVRCTSGVESFALARGEYGGPQSTSAGGPAPLPAAAAVAAAVAAALLAHVAVKRALTPRG